MQHFPLNPECPLTPALSPDGGEGDRSRGLFEVQGFNARNWLRGILTMNLVAADVSPLHLNLQKSEPPYVGCYRLGIWRI
jgi:hypothetical protein